MVSNGNRETLVTVTVALATSAMLVFGLDVDVIGGLAPDRPSAERKPATTTATTTRVIDGDTITVTTKQGADTVRLIGVDAPEITWPSDSNDLSEPQPECFGMEARGFLQELVVDRRVKLAGDSSQPARDKYGRRLAYVYVNGSLINKQLLKTGHARELSVGDGYARQASFSVASESARENNRGLWKQCR